MTEISDVCGYRLKNGKKIPCDGELYYQGYNVMDLVKSFENRRFAFEETSLFADVWRTADTYSVKGF